MDLDDLKLQWSALDDKLEASIRLNAAVLHQSVARRTRSYLRRELILRTPGLLVEVVAVLWLGSFLADHIGQLRFAAPAALLGLFALFLLATTIRHLARVGGLDFDAPVTVSQRHIEELKVEVSRVSKVALLLSPLMWTPLVIVLFKGLLGVDVYARFDMTWLVGNLLFGVAIIPLSLWIARRYGDRLRAHPVLKGMLDDLSGHNLRAASAYLESMARFERPQDEDKA